MRSWSQSPPLAAAAIKPVHPASDSSTTRSATVSRSRAIGDLLEGAGGRGLERLQKRFGLVLAQVSHLASLPSR